MKRKIRCILKRRGHDPQVICIPDDEDKIKEIVGGLVGMMQSFKDAAILFDRDADIKPDTKYNCRLYNRPFFSPIIFIGYDKRRKRYKDFPMSFTDFRETHLNLFTEPTKEVQEDAGADNCPF